MAKGCKWLSEDLLEMLLVFGSASLFEGILCYLLIAKIITCGQVLYSLLGTFFFGVIIFCITMWIKRQERLRNLKRMREYLAKDRPPARQHRVHPFAFDPPTTPDVQPLTHKQLFEPDQLLRTLLPRRQVTLCEVHQYNKEAQNNESELREDKNSTLQRSRSLPLFFPSNIDSLFYDKYTVEGEWYTK